MGRNILSSLDPKHQCWHLLKCYLYC